MEFIDLVSVTPRVPPAAPGGPNETLPRLDAQVDLRFAIHAVDAFVVLALARHVPQIQNAQHELHERRAEASRSSQSAISTSSVGLMRTHR